MLKENGNELIKLLIVLINKCLEKGQMPKKGNEAVCVLSLKRGDRTKVANYKPNIAVFAGAQIAN